MQPCKVHVFGCKAYCLPIQWSGQALQVANRHAASAPMNEPRVALRKSAVPEATRTRCRAFPWILADHSKRCGAFALSRTNIHQSKSQPESLEESLHFERALRASHTRCGSFVWWRRRAGKVKDALPAAQRPGAAAVSAACLTEGVSPFRWLGTEEQRVRCNLSFSSYFFSFATSFWVGAATAADAWKTAGCAAAFCNSVGKASRILRPPWRATN